MSGDRRPVERVRGTQDYWPRDARRLDAAARSLEATFAAFGFEPVQVPAIETADLHLRKSGLEIITKLYAFADQGGRHLCLRPELTASIVRAFTASPAPRLPVKVYCTGPVFRYERPARGRYRQFIQSGAEVIGAAGPAADAEMIGLAASALQRLGLRRYRIVAGHVGLLGQLLGHLGLASRLRIFLLESLEEARRRGLDTVKARLRELDPELFEQTDTGTTAFTGLAPEQVEGAIAGVLQEVGSDSLGRRTQDEVAQRLRAKLQSRSDMDEIERTFAFIERLLAIEGDTAAVLQQARALLDSYGLSDEPVRHLEATLALVQQYGVPESSIQLDLGMSRGLQYYTGMVFEIEHDGLGAENQLCGGGRYDDLVRALGGKSTPALGFAFGVERVAFALEAEGIALGTEVPDARVFVVAATPASEASAVQAAQELRQTGTPAHLEVAPRSLRNSLAFAGRERFSHAVIVEDAQAGTVRLRELATGQEWVAPLLDITRLLQQPPLAAGTGKTQVQP